MRKILIGLAFWSPILLFFFLSFLFKDVLNKNLNLLYALFIGAGVVLVFDWVLASWSFNDRLIERANRTSPGGSFMVVMFLTLTVIGTIYVMYLTGKKADEKFFDRY